MPTDLVGIKQERDLKRGFSRSTGLNINKTMFQFIKRMHLLMPFHNGHSSIPLTNYTETHHDHALETICGDRPDGCLLVDRSGASKRRRVS